VFSITGDCVGLTIINQLVCCHWSTRRSPRRHSSPVLISSEIVSCRNRTA